MKRQIAIDFGTTTSVIHYRDVKNDVEKSSQFIPFSNHPYTPSLILPEGSVTNSKGRTLSHPQEEYGWDAQVAHSFYALLKRKFKMELLSADPVQREESKALTMRFFRFLFLAYAENNETIKGETYDTATIVTYPAKFTEEAKAVLQEAAETAGFPNVVLRMEAEGAMQYAMTFDSQETKDFFAANKGKTLKIMLIDMGAGTMDIAIFSSDSSQPDQYQLLACYPKENGCSFGGAEIDQALLRYYQNAVPWPLPDAVKPKDPAQGEVLLEYWMKSYKENQLSRRLAKNELVETEPNIANLYYLKTDEELELDMDQATFETILKDYLSQFPELVEGALKEAGLKGDQIDLVLLTGGHSQWYFVKKLLKQTSLKISDTRVLTFPNPHLVVAKGASYLSKPVPAPIPELEPEPTPVPKTASISMGRYRAPVMKDGKCGYIDENGTEVLPCQWEAATGFRDGIAWVYQNGTVSRIDKNGNLLPSKEIEIWHALLHEYFLASVETKKKIRSLRKTAPYQEINDHLKQCYIVSQNNKIGIIDRSGNWLIQPKFNRYKQFQNYICVEQWGQWGILNCFGKLITPVQWEDAVYLGEDRLAVRRNGKWGILNESGTLICPCQWKEVSPFRNGLARIKDDEFIRKWAPNRGQYTKKVESYGFIGRSGQIAIPCRFKDAALFSEGLASVMTHEGHCQYINRQGDVMINEETCGFAWQNMGSSFRDGLASVKRASGYAYIDPSGTVVATRYCHEAFPFDHGMAIIQHYHKYGLIDKDGLLLTPCQWDSIIINQDGLAEVRMQQKEPPHSLYGLIDRNGKQILSCSYQSISSFGSGLIRVQQNRKFGLINRQGRVISDCQWDSLWQYHCGLVRVTRGGKVGFLNKYGDLVLPLQWDNAGNFA